MKLIAGLGNPGTEYSYSRHNMGFLVLDSLAQREDIEISRVKFRSRIGKGIISGVPVILAKPQTFMNLSGVAVGKLAGYFNIRTDDIVIVHDDLDFSVGDVRIKKGGGTAGHKGLISIVNHLGGTDFARVRLGIGRPAAVKMTENYVLEWFSRGEMPDVSHAVEKACDAVVEIISSDVQAAMNTFNVRDSKESSEEI